MSRRERPSPGGGTSEGWRRVSTQGSGGTSMPTGRAIWRSRSRRRSFGRPPASPRLTGFARTMQCTWPPQLPRAGNSKGPWPLAARTRPWSGGGAQLREHQASAGAPDRVRSGLPGTLPGGGSTMRYEIISADCHIDLCWLPPDLFVTSAPSEWRDRMPYVTDCPKRPVSTTKKGASLGRACGMGSAGREYVPGRIYRSDRMAATGLYEDGKRGIRRVTDPELRLRDQERDGVQGEVLYGVLGTT